MKSYKNVLCISGTHGKSTTTGMVSTIFVKADMDPTIQLGATLPIIGGNARIGGKEFFIAEACEYVDTFLKYHLFYAQKNDMDLFPYRFLFYAAA